MHPNTIATLNQLSNSQWFRNVGVHDSEVVSILTTWDDAIESCASIEWENLCLEGANQYRERLVERSVARFQNWNSIVSIVKPAAVTLAREKTKDVIREHNLPKVFLDTVEWDMVHLAMECEYADVFPPGFYAAQAYWYLQGHFPCGWIGRFPKGKRVVF